VLQGALGNTNQNVDLVEIPGALFFLLDVLDEFDVDMMIQDTQILQGNGEISLWSPRGVILESPTKTWGFIYHKCDVSFWIYIPVCPSKQIN
jgi:hypothetical protein